MKRVGIEQIANQLGVSRTLVSLVLNGKAKENRISDDMAKKVTQLAEKLNYTPNFLAQSLRKGTTNTIGLVVGDISNPFFSKIARFIEDEAAIHGYQLIMASTDENAEKAENLINLLISKKVDGLLISASHKNSQALMKLKKLQIPFVLVDRYQPKIKTNYVGLNNAQGMKLAVESLIDKGIKKIALITYQKDLSNIKERIDSYKETLIEHGLKRYNRYIQTISHENFEEDTKNTIDTLLSLKQVPEAIVFTYSGVGVYGLEYLQKRKIRIPQDISIISFDDELAFRVSSPPVTVVEQPLKKIAVKATNLLVQNMQSKEKLPEEHIIEVANLIVRQS